jgi:hypothetical protein
MTDQMRKKRQRPIEALPKKLVVDQSPEFHSAKFERLLATLGAECASGAPGEGKAMTRAGVTVKYPSVRSQRTVRSESRFERKLCTLMGSDSDITVEASQGTESPARG